MSILKRALLCALAAACALSLAAPALACGGCHGGRARRAAQPCSVEACTCAGWHYHDGVLYRGHTHGQGLCNGGCCPLCPVEGCALTGRHVHDSVIYCGANHAAGYCDGSGPCAQASPCSGGRCGHHGWRG